MTRQEQIATLINEHSSLTVTIHAGGLPLQNYVTETDGSEIFGCAKVEKLAWYLAEISHLVVEPTSRGRGLGQNLVRQACDRARKSKARIAQCTIRMDNVASRKLFRKLGFTEGAAFNGPSGARVSVWQKEL